MRSTDVLYEFWSGRKDGRSLRCVLRGTSCSLTLQLFTGEDTVREQALDTLYRVFEWQDTWRNELVARGWDIVPS
jgi:hypothetical protein